ncbi:MAG: SIS domain-containing protein [Patescibacteria group bacterium]
MQEQIRNFAKQLDWPPVVENSGELFKTNKFIVCGLGGSALAAGLLKVAEPNLDLLIHRDYGLPRVPEYFLRESLIILSSYSGNTAEVLDAGREALARGLNLAVIATGGELLDWAKSNNLAHVVLSAGLQPRMALGYACKALGALMSDEKMLATLSTTVLAAASLEAMGEALGAKLRERIPVIYSSNKNYNLAYHWKIACNETGKTPAYANACPELDHNELESDFSGQNFYFIFLRDETGDDARITKSLDKIVELYKSKNLNTEVIELAGATVWSKIFHSMILANWTALQLAKLNGREPEPVLVVEEFKKLIS